MLYNDLWVEKYRPSTLADILLPKNVKEFFCVIDKSDNKDIPHLLFSGKPGIGKTSLSKIIVNDILKCEYLYINASDHNSIDDVRGSITTFVQTKSFDGLKKVIILDECDNLSVAAQSALRNLIEEYTKYARFILTCNYVSRVSEPIRSRCQSFDLLPDFDEYMKRCVKILLTEKVTIHQDEKSNLKALIASCYPDLRKAINSLQKYSITGVFLLSSKNGLEDIATQIFNMIESKASVFEIRKYVIDNEREFGSDYHSLMRSLFDQIYESKFSNKDKMIVMLLITDAMKDSQIVLDQELNFFSMIIKISQGRG